jgi:hypothetical protein
MTLTNKDFLLINEELNFSIATDDFWLHDTQMLNILL